MKICSLFLEKISVIFPSLKWNAYIEIVSNLFDVNYTIYKSNINIFTCEKLNCIVGFTFNEEIKNKQQIILQNKIYQYQQMKQYKKLVKPKETYLKPKAIKINFKKSKQAPIFEKVVAKQNTLKERRELQHFTYMSKYGKSDGNFIISTLDQQNHNNIIYFESWIGESEIIKASKLTINNKKSPGIWDDTHELIRKGQVDLIVKFQ